MTDLCSVPAQVQISWRISFGSFVHLIMDHPEGFQAIIIADIYNNRKSLCIYFNIVSCPHVTLVLLLQLISYKKVYVVGGIKNWLSSNNAIIEILFIVAVVMKGCIFKNSFPSLLLGHYCVGNLIVCGRLPTYISYTRLDRLQHCTPSLSVLYLFSFCGTNETFVMIKSIVIMRIHSYILKYVLTIGTRNRLFFIYFLLHVIVNNFRMGCNSDEGRCFTVAVCVCVCVCVCKYYQV